MAPPQVSPRRTDNVPQISPRQQGTSPSSLPTKQGSAESTLVSLLSQPPSKDDKHLRRPSGSEQEFPSPKVNTMASLFHLLENLMIIIWGLVGWYGGRFNY